MLRSDLKTYLFFSSFKLRSLQLRELLHFNHLIASDFVKRSISFINLALQISFCADLLDPRPCLFTSPQAYPDFPRATPSFSARRITVQYIINTATRYFLGLPNEIQQYKGELQSSDQKYKLSICQKE